MAKLTEGPAGADLLKKSEPKNFVGLGYWDNGSKVMAANKAIHKPEDMKGLKLRIQSTTIYLMQALRRCRLGSPAATCIK